MRSKSQYSIKTIVVLTIVLLLSVSIAMSLSFLYSYRLETGNSKKEQYLSGMETLSRQMEDKITDITRLQKNMAMLDVTRSFTEKSFYGDFSEIRKQYVTIKGSNSFIEDIVLINNNGKFFSCLGSHDYDIHSLLEVEGETTGILNTEVPKYYIANPVWDVKFENKIGKIIFVVSGNVFLSDIKSTRVDENSRYVIAYSSNPIKPIMVCGYVKNLPDNWMFKNFNSPELSFNPLETDDEKYYVAQVTLEDYGLIAYMIVPSKTLAAKWPENVMLYFALWILSIVLILTLLIRLFTAMKYSSKRIEQMLESIGKQDESFEETVIPIIEFHDVAGSIITMTETINTLNSQNLLAEKQLLEKELSNRKAVLKALRNQINPHFIYNTLSCVKNMGMEHGDSRISEICDSIIHILRYSIKESSTAMVREEIESLESYLFIQSCRFSGRFSYKISVDDSIMNCQMLRFLLQPILENAIVHGISPQKTNGRIIISGKSKGEKIVFDISDTGVGIPPHVLEKINKRLNEDTPISEEDDGHGIGLANINSRLKLFYGDECSIKINSVLNMGTFINISFPRIDGQNTEEKNC